MKDNSNDSTMTEGDAVISVDAELAGVNAVCDSFADVANQVLALKKKAKDNQGSEEVRKLISEGYVTSLLLKRANRSVYSRVESVKGRTTKGREELDTVDSHVQNLLYERNHYTREIRNCRDWEYSESDPNFVSLEEFQNSAPPSMTSGGEEDGGHQLMLNRLTFELQERKRLREEVDVLTSRKRAMLEVNRSKHKFLSSLKDQLKNIHRAAKPIKEHIAAEQFATSKSIATASSSSSSSSSSTTAKTSVREDLTPVTSTLIIDPERLALLPNPLYILYTQAASFQATYTASGAPFKVEAVGSRTSAREWREKYLNRDIVETDAPPPANGVGNDEGEICDDDNNIINNADDDSMADASSVTNGTLTTVAAEDEGDDANDSRRRRRRGRRADEDDTEVEEKVKDAAEEEREYYRSLQRSHPLSVTLTFPSHNDSTGKQTVVLQFRYLYKLNIVSVKSSTRTSSNNSNEWAFSPASSLLCNLFPADTGLSTPTPSSKYLGKSEFKLDQDVVGTPYRWAQALCGLDEGFSELPHPIGEDTLQFTRKQMKEVVARIVFRAGLNKQLTTQLKTLAEKAVPKVDSFQQSVKCTVRNWTEVSKADFLCDRSLSSLGWPTWAFECARFFRMELARRSTNDMLLAFVALSPEYPVRPPLLLLAFHPSSERTKPTSVPVSVSDRFDLESAKKMSSITTVDTNLIDMENALALASVTACQPDDAMCLSLQLRRLQKCFDTCVDGVGGSAASDGDMNGVRQHRGRGRQLPLAEVLGLTKELL